MKGKFLGFVEPDRNRFVILGEVHADGMKWYKIDHPTKKGTACIAADYVELLPIGSEFADIRLKFGNYPEKSRELLGTPSRQGQNFLIYLDSGYSLSYDDKGLYEVEIQREGKVVVAGIRTGDKVKKLLALGMPESMLDAESDEEVDDVAYWDYEYKDKGSEKSITFQFSGSPRDSEIEGIFWRRQPYNDE